MRSKQRVWFLGFLAFQLCAAMSEPLPLLPNICSVDRLSRQSSAELLGIMQKCLVNTNAFQCLQTNGYAFIVTLASGAACRSCGGRGYVTALCETCGGFGIVPKSAEERQAEGVENGGAGRPRYKPCPRCGDSKETQTVRPTCLQCRGQGTEEGSATSIFCLIPSLRVQEASGLDIMNREWSVLSFRNGSSVERARIRQTWGQRIELQHSKGRGFYHLGTFTSAAAIELAEYLARVTEPGVAGLKGAIDLDDCLRNGDTLVSWLVSHNLTEALQIALGALAPEERQALLSGRPLLSMAAEKAGAEMVRALLGEGLNPNERNGEGFSALQVAVKNGRAAVVAVLLSGGANPNDRADQTRTPLYMAIESGNAEIARALLAAGADPNDHGGIRRTPLHAAVESNRLDLVELLLEAKARPNEADETGQSPLHKAVERGQEVVVNALLSAGADPNQRNGTDRTPLHVACLRRNNALERILHKAGADYRIKDQAGKTPDDYVARTPLGQVVYILTKPWGLLLIAFAVVCVVVGFVWTRLDEKAYEWRLRKRPRWRRADKL